MAKFTPGEPIATDISRIVVETELPPGRYRFQLVVVDEQGQESLPDIQTVVVSRGRVIPDGPLRPDNPLQPDRPLRPDLPLQPDRSLRPNPLRPDLPLRPQNPLRPRRFPNPGGPTS